MQVHTIPAVKLSNEQQYALEKFKRGENLFVSGPGGTGKSKLIQSMIEHLRDTHRKYQVCAMTGCAAVLLNCGARTIHSWSGMKLGKGDRDKIITGIMRNRKACSEWRTTTVLIVDEVSMMSARMFDLLDLAGRMVRRNTNPFGGIQVVFTGDFFQLPPVAGEGDDMESAKFCFQSMRWRSVFPLSQCVILTTIFRQTDPVYIEILNQIRQGYLSEEYAQILQSHVNRPYSPAEHGGCMPTKLFPIRSKVESINNRMFEDIQNDEYEFEYIQKTNATMHMETKKAIPIADRLKTKELTAKQIEYEIESLLNHSRCARSLSLKVGASVMCTINLNVDLGICNGSQGIIVRFVESSEDDGFAEIPVVRFSNGITMKIGVHYWHSEEYPNIVIGQIPLCLAWAMTIHKIQGATLKMAEMDIGSRVFEYGQTYVALSRIQSLDGLYLSSFHPDRIKANPDVIAFYQSIPLRKDAPEANAVKDPSTKVVYM
jgi:ATP-dependent DNA helicase PIF1